MSGDVTCATHGTSARSIRRDPNPISPQKVVKKGAKSVENGGQSLCGVNDGYRAQGRAEATWTEHQRKQEKPPG